MAFQLSPGVVTSEVDLTTVVPSAGTTTGAFAGVFQWGPAELASQVENEIRLVEVFGKPDTNTAVSFFTCANFLNYGNDLRVVRAVSGTNTRTSTASGNSTFLIKNEDQYFTTYYSSNTTTAGAWAARYPGALGNSLKVSVWANTNTTHFDAWAYKSYFDSAPGTSAYVSNVSGTNDEMHIVVVDEDGLFSGTAGTVLETFAFVSKASDAKDSIGNSNYYKDVIWRKSKYVYWTDHLDAVNTATTWGTTAAGKSFAQLVNVAAVYATSLSGGADGIVAAGNVQTGYSKFIDADQIDVSLIMTGDAAPATALYAINSVAEVRKDCVAFVSPALANVTSSTPSDDVVNYRKNALSNVSSSYAVMDSGWKYQYDKYNDVYRWIPLNGDVAGLCVRTDLERDSWFSPAGSSRGQIKNVIKLAYYPAKADRDTLYKNGINPVVSFAGEGTILFGDKTMLSKPSAFDRINVRRLFITLEKAISRAAKAQLFEFNDEFTRSQFVSIVEPFLRTVKGRRGITDFKVVCNSTNNTSDVIDRNEFVGDIYVKPNRSINFIQLNFVAVRTGVSFDEVVGRF
jgi:phage tail sheath protein FI